MGPVIELPDEEQSLIRLNMASDQFSLVSIWKVDCNAYTTVEQHNGVTTVCKTYPLVQ